jgi:hypothetical protein
VKNCENNFESWFLLDWMDINWNSATVINNAQGTISHQGNFDLGAISSERLIYCVIDDLVDKVVETTFAGRTDIHSWALANRLKALEDGDGRGVVALLRIAHPRTSYGHFLFGTPVLKIALKALRSPIRSG